MKQRELSSTKVRDDLRRLAISVRDGEGDVTILHSGKPFALLTLTLPTPKPAAVLRRIAQAQRDWANLLAAVTVDDARFRFKWKERPAVFLLRAPGFLNEHVYQWRDHLHQFEPDVSTLVQRDIEKLFQKVSELGDRVEEVKRIATFLFADRNRKGDVMATPENGIVPLRSVDDFEPVERD
jgi:hypothetical protein